MFECTLGQAALLKKVLDAIVGLVKDCNFDVTHEGLSAQAMDGSHVALIALNLRSDGFEAYRCDRSLSLGMPPPCM